jgi:ABC-type multidrug transport system ATPase subunit
MNQSQAIGNAANPYAVELRGVSHHYGVRPVLREINLAIWPGQRVVIVGPNGMGKTTLLGLMAGVLFPLHGTVAVHGLLRRSSEENELAIRRQTVYIPDQAFLPKLRTGREWLLGVGNLYEIEIDRLIDHVDRLLRLFDLSQLGDAPVSSYSAGQRKKLALCGAFVSEATLLLLDEPFSGGLDPSGILAVKRLISRLAQENEGTIVLTTPVPELVEEVADVVVVLRDGQIVAQGSVEQLKQQTGASRTLSEALERLVFPETLSNLDYYFHGRTP